MTRDGVWVCVRALILWMDIKSLNNPSQTGSPNLQLILLLLMEELGRERDIFFNNLIFIFIFRSGREFRAGNRVWQIGRAKTHRDLVPARVCRQRYATITLCARIPVLCGSCGTLVPPSHNAFQPAVIVPSLFHQSPPFSSARTRFSVRLSGRALPVEAIASLADALGVQWWTV